MSDVQFAEALRATTARQWRRAHALWRASPGAADNPLTLFCLVQTAVHVGDGAAAAALLPRLAPALLRFPSVQAVIRRAEQLVALQQERPRALALTGRQLGRALMQGRHWLAALEAWSQPAEDRATAAERSLRLAQLHLRLGDYDEAAPLIHACASTRHAQRALALQPACDAGQERVARLQRRAVGTLPHPLLKELAAALASEAALPPLAWLALGRDALLGGHDSFADLLLRAMTADEDALLLELPDEAVPLLRAFLTSPRFAAMQSPALTAFLGRCAARRGLRDLPGLAEAAPAATGIMDLAGLLGRGLAAGDEEALAALAPEQEAELAAYLRSAAFRPLDTPAMRNYLARCCIKRGFFAVVDWLIDETPAPPPAAEEPAAAPAAQPAARRTKPAPAPAAKPRAQARRKKS